MTGGRIDHLVIAADDLERGRAWVEERLGLPMEAGGEHAMWGTHNALLSLGPDTYLEVLAVNPAVPRPQPYYPMALGTDAVRRRLRHSPFLHHWYSRVSRLPEDAVELRRGANRWRSRPLPEGRLLLAGVVPSHIEWLTAHPGSLLPDRGARLVELALVVPDEAELRRLAPDDLADPRLVVEPAGPGGRPALRATITTPRGQVTL